METRRHSKQMPEREMGAAKAGGNLECTNRCQRMPYSKGMGWVGGGEAGAWAVSGGPGVLGVVYVVFHGSTVGQLRDAFKKDVILCQ